MLDAQTKWLHLQHKTDRDALLKRFDDSVQRLPGMSELLRKKSSSEAPSFHQSWNLLLRHNWNFLLSSLEIDPFERPSPHPDSYLHINPRTRIPDKCITGPFDDEMRDYLLWLVLSGARLQLKSQTWELTLQGFREIEKMGDCPLAAQLTYVFHILGVFCQWPPSILEDVLQEECDTRKSLNSGSGNALFILHILHGELRVPGMRR